MIVFSTNIVVNEYQWGTIRQMFMKPISRWKIYAAKYVTTLVVMVILSGVLILGSLITGYIFFMDNTTTIYEVVVTNGEITLVNMISLTIQYILASMFTICVINGISMSVATLFRSNILTVLVSLGLWLGDAVVGESLNHHIIYKVFIMPNLNLENYLAGGYLPYEGATLISSITISVAYLIMFLSIGCSFFSKREIY